MIPGGMWRRRVAASLGAWLGGGETWVGVAASHRFVLSGLLCHASTIACVPDGVVVAWFAGSDEGHPDVGIWLSRSGPDRVWSEPRRVAVGQDGSGIAQPCWNPVLWHAGDGRLLLHYKVGPSPRRWWGMVLESPDAGRSWGPPVALPEGMIGPVRSKPELLEDGWLLCPSSTEDEGWRLHMELFNPDTGRWQRQRPIADPEGLRAIQPSLLRLGNGRLRLLCRTKAGVLGSADSRDLGRSWGALASTGLPNPNSGADTLTLGDGRHLLVYNPSRRRRWPLALALSEDGRSWRGIAILEGRVGEYSYPAIVQDPAGDLHVTYTCNLNSIKYLRVFAKVV